MNGQLAGNLVGFLVMGAGMWFFVGRRSPAKRSLDGERWARRHVAYVPPSWRAEVDRQLQVNRYLEIAAFLFIFLALHTFSSSSRAWIAWLAVVPGLLALGRGLTIARAAARLPPGSRVARIRELELADYLPLRARASMWVAVALACCLLTAAVVRRSSVVLIVPVVLLLAAAAAVEWAGARLARMPEPAEDATQLYCQDAFRADAMRFSVGMVGTSAGLLCVAAPDLLGVDSSSVPWILLIIAGALLLLVLLDGVRVRNEPAAYMRSRLWPSLAPGQVLMPGDPVPSRGAVA